MTRILRFGKRFALAALIAGTLLAVAQVVFASPPEASFTPTLDAGTPATGCRSMTFTSTSTDPENDIDTITWDFGDGSTGSGSSVSHIYATPGSKHVTMTATDLDTAGDTVETDTAEQDVTIPNAAPTAGFTVSANPQAGQPVGFTANAADGDGTIAGYAWDFDDDVDPTGTGAAPTHTFNDHTAHTVSLVVTDNCGDASVAATQAVTPGNTAPAVVAAPTATVGGTAATVANPGETVSFAVAPTDANNDGFTYAWDLDGDGQYDDSTLAAPTHVYPATPAAANVSVQVSDGIATTTSPALAFRVNQPPVAAFSNDPESPAVGEPVTFNAATSHDVENAASPLTYEWDLDGTGNYVAGTATPPTHVYNTIGNVTVHLRVTDPDGGVTTLPKTITVQKTRPTARLRYSPANPLPGQAITLTSTSVPSATAGAPAIALTQWDLDYAATGVFSPAASGGTVTTSFATAGVHTVAVRVTDGANGTDIASAPIVVNARPRASFTVRPSKPREGGEITFISTSSDPDGPIAKQEWDLDNDGRYDDGTGVVASTKKLKKGPRTVRLRVTDSKGATDLNSQQVKVGAKPLLDPPDVNTSYGYARRAWGIRLVGFWVTVPPRTTVKVTCKGSGCPRGTLIKRSKSKGKKFGFDALVGSLRAGARITVVTYRTGTKAEYFTLTVRGSYKPPLKRKRCKALTAKKYGSCG